MPGMPARRTIRQSRTGLVNCGFGQICNCPKPGNLARQAKQAARIFALFLASGLGQNQVFRALNPCNENNMQHQYGQYEQLQDQLIDKKDSRGATNQNNGCYGQPLCLSWDASRLPPISDQRPEEGGIKQPAIEPFRGLGKACCGHQQKWRRRQNRQYSPQAGQSDEYTANQNQQIFWHGNKSA